MLSLLDAVSEGIDGGWFYFWDTMAAVAAAHPEVMGNRDLSIRVVLDEGNTLGQTVESSDGVNVRIAEEFNRDVFENEFLKTVLD